MKNQRNFDFDFLHALSRWIAGRQYSAPWDQRPKAWYRRWRAYLLFLPVSYLLLPLVIFDFTGKAVPDGEDNYAGKSVAIGPRPRSWVPGAAHGYDIPGGADYDPRGWPFRLWKPLCILYCKVHGYALPVEWR